MKEAVVSQTIIDYVFRRKQTNKIQTIITHSRFKRTGKNGGDDHS